MTDETTARHSLPLMQPGQAQKEMTHNEALILIDSALFPAVSAIAMNTPPDGPAPGDSWIVGEQPTGAWEGAANALATWIEGGWRFVAARDGMRVWSAAAGHEAAFVAGAWEHGVLRGERVIVAGKQVIGDRAAAIADPEGGAVIDEQARASLAHVLQALRTHGLIAP